jgi:hypothetical protein
MNQALALFFDSLPSLVGHGRFSGQAQNLLLGIIPSLARGHKLISQNRHPLGCFGCFTMSGRLQHGSLWGHPFRMGRAGTRHYGSRLCSSHLLLKLLHLSRVPL